MASAEGPSTETAPGGRDGPAPRLLFVNQHYWPDVAATGQHLTDLAEHLAREGFEVEVLTSRARYEGGEMEAPAEETRRGVRIRRTRVPGFGRAGGLGHLGRVLDYLAFFLPALVRVLAGPRRDAVVYLTTPPLLPVLGLLGEWLRGQPYGVWSMDLHPETEEALGIFDGESWYAGLLRKLSDAAYRGAEFVVDLGPVMKRRIEAKGVDRGRLRTIPVWNDGDEVRPVPAEENPLAESLSVGDLHLVTLKPAMAGVAAPGKLYGILAAGRPALMVGPRESEPGLVIEVHGVGEVIDPAALEDGEGAEAVADVVLRARENPGQCREVGRRAREVFEERYSAAVALGQWEELLREEVGSDGER